MYWYQISEKPKVTGFVVYKIKYAGKYVIIGGKEIVRSISNINISLHRFFKDTPSGRNPNDLYYNFYCHVDDFPMQEFKIEILSDTENPYTHLKNWFLELRKSKGDHKCLNLYFEPYIPKDTQKKKQSWLNRGAYLNYMKWKQKFSNETIV